MAKLSERLRCETAVVHRQMEAAVGFDIHRPNRTVAVHMLRAFYGLLRVLEPSVMALVPRRIAQDRAKLHLLRRDLHALGMSGDQIDAIELPQVWLPGNPGEAAGALYVLEGSTLGGKVIAKALRKLENWPITGTNYLDPYGSATGAKWAQFQAYLDELPVEAGDCVIAAAEKTFLMMDSGIAAQANA